MEWINSSKYGYPQAQEPTQFTIDGQPVPEINAFLESHPPMKYFMIKMAVSTPDYNKIAPTPGINDPRLARSIVSVAQQTKNNDNDDDDDDDEEEEEGAVVEDGAADKKYAAPWWTEWPYNWSARDPRKPWLRRGVCDAVHSAAFSPNPIPPVDQDFLTMTCLHLGSSSVANDPAMFSSSSSPYAMSTALFN